MSRWRDRLLREIWGDSIRTLTRPDVPSSEAIFVRSDRLDASVQSIRIPVAKATANANARIRVQPLGKNIRSNPEILSKLRSKFAGSWVWAKKWLRRCLWCLNERTKSTRPNAYAGKINREAVTTNINIKKSTH